MPIPSSQSLSLILTMAAMTMLIRFLPFLLFSKNTPKLIMNLADLLPYSVMAMLVVYCLKGTDILGPSHGLPEIISVIFVVILHKWKHNTLLSILCGTLCYMALVQFIF